MQRRRFIKQISLAMGSVCLPSMQFDTSSWENVRALFDIEKYPLIHLNSGSSGIVPIPVQQQLQALSQLLNSLPIYEFVEEQKDIWLQTIANLGNQIGAAQSETVIVRNTTEALNLIIFGYPYQAGDHVLCSNVDYPYAVGSLRQAKKKHGFELEQINLSDLHQLSDDEIVNRYRQHLKENTKLLLVSYVNYIDGRIMPVKRITELAHANGTEVILDAAHAYGHFDHNVKDLGVDYYATSLHKWLCAPHGSGLLYIEAKHISKIQPPLPWMNDDDSIEKFRHLGTRAYHQEIGLQYCLDFQEQIGLDRKTKRLFDLTKYWTSRVVDIPKVDIVTPIHPRSCGGVAGFAIDGYNGKDLVKQLATKHNIHAKAVAYLGGKSFVRISPNIFTLENELDALVQAIDIIAK